ncbi:hypothetical protein J009_01932 [Cryptococcus neoformans]|nr:hypothetical protein J009_01932 [Cryptococcus neoformans var. grubii]
MLILYLRALYAAPFTPSTLLYPSPASSLSPRQQWEKEVSLALKNGQALLEQSTTFPRAGAVNHPVVLFSQLAIQLYTLLPRSRALSDQVLNLLWWATTLTFQSQSVLRSLVRILADRQEYSDAKRVFELYVGLVLKARQTAQPEISLQLQRRPTDDDAAHPTDIQRQASQATRAVDPASPATEALVKQATSASYEADGDTDFVPTLLAGAKWLTEGLNEPEEAWRYACLAGDVVQISKLASADTKQLEARVEEVKGIVRMLMARNVNPHERANYQSQSLNHLTFSTTISPTPTSLYHLSHTYAQARKIPQAIDAIRKSLEMDEKNVEGWHLLGVLLTSMRDWEAARMAVEAGWRVWEERDEKDRRMEEEGEGTAVEDLIGTRPEITSKDFAAPFANTTASSPLVLPTGTLPPLPPLPESPPTPSSKLAQVIRLRMTLNMIIEKTLGCEEAMVRQQELFAFFSARCSLAAATKQSQSGGGGGGEKKEVPDREDGLGESFVNIKEQEKEKTDSPIQITTTSPNDVPTLATPIPPTPPSLDPAPPTDVQMINENTLAPFRSVSEKGQRRRSLSLSLRSKGNKSKNQLGVLPARAGGGGTGRTASLRGAVLSGEAEKTAEYGGGGGGLQPLTFAGANPRDRTISHSTAPSIVPTAIHSHYRSSRARPFPPPAAPPPSAPSKPSPLDSRSPQEKRILSDLWLASAATFRRWGKLEQCLVSVMEAEGLDPGNEDVWVQLGMYHVANTAMMTMSSKAGAGAGGVGKGQEKEDDNDDGEQEQVWKPAEEAFSKSLLLKTDHPPALVNLAKLYLSTSTLQNLSTSTPTNHAPKRYQGADLAESLLNPFTQSIGWDIPEAWYLLGHVARVQGREERARECWEFALGLEQGRGIRDWSCLKRWL